VALRERDIEENGAIPHEEAKKHFRDYFQKLKAKR